MCKNLAYQYLLLGKLYIHSNLGDKNGIFR